MRFNDIINPSGIIIRSKGNDNTNYNLNLSLSFFVAVLIVTVIMAFLYAFIIKKKKTEFLFEENYACGFLNLSLFYIQIGITNLSTSYVFLIQYLELEV